MCSYKFFYLKRVVGENKLILEGLSCYGGLNCEGTGVCAGCEAESVADEGVEGERKGAWFSVD
jgi:hypothetical protein